MKDNIKEFQNNPNEIQRQITILLEQLAIMDKEDEKDEE
jgi:hypothetical protein